MVFGLDRGRILRCKWRDAAAIEVGTSTDAVVAAGFQDRRFSGIQIIIHRL
jgi:hypothetical protein